MPDRATTHDQLAAPVEADFVTALDFTETLYPVPEVEITAYETIEYDEDTVSDITEGCDKALEHARPVRELRGDSNDIVYLVAAALDRAVTGSAAAKMASSLLAAAERVRVHHGAAGTVKVDQNAQPALV